jgi:hypothetical protein
VAIHYVCAFCAQDIEPSDLTAVSLAITSLRNQRCASQAFAAHGACLAERLHTSVPFDAEVFAD